MTGRPDAAHKERHHHPQQRHRRNRISSRYYQCLTVQQQQQQQHTRQHVHAASTAAATSSSRGTSGLPAHQQKTTTHTHTHSPRKPTEPTPQLYCCGCRGPPFKSHTKWIASYGNISLDWPYICRNCNLGDDSRKGRVTLER